MFYPAGSMLEPSGEEDEGLPRKLPEKGCGVCNEEVEAHLEHDRKACPGQKPMEN